MVTVVPGYSSHLEGLHDHAPSPSPQTFPVPGPTRNGRRRSHRSGMPCSACTTRDYPGTSPTSASIATGRSFAPAAGRRCSTSETKYKSGSGWPSFYAAREGAVVWIARSGRCAWKCGGHLGHVFPDGPPSAGATAPTAAATRLRAGRTGQEGREKDQGGRRARKRRKVSGAGQGEKDGGPGEGAFPSPGPLFCELAPRAQSLALDSKR